MGKATADKITAIIAISCTWIVLTEQPTLGQPSPPPPSNSEARTGKNIAAAEQLFLAGRELMATGNIAAACDKFAASLELDSTLGTRLNLANCYEKLGKLASAWAQYRGSAEFASRARDERREAYARDRARQLKPRLPRLTISVVAARRIPGLQVTRNQTPVASALLGTGVFVDPGQHTIAATADGYQQFTTAISIGEGQALVVDIPALQAVPASTAQPTTSSAAPAATGASPDATIAPPGRIDQNPQPHSPQTVTADRASRSGPEALNRQRGPYVEVHGGSMAAYVPVADTDSSEDAVFDGLGWGVAAGYFFKPAVAIEVGFLRVDTEFATQDDGDIPYLDAKVPYLTARFHIPIGRRVNVAFKTGAMYMEHVVFGTRKPTGEKDEETLPIPLPLFGVGVSVAVTPMVAISAQYQGLLLLFVNAGMVSAGVNLHF